MLFVGLNPPKLNDHNDPCVALALLESEQNMQTLQPRFLPNEFRMMKLTLCPIRVAMEEGAVIHTR
jgi:hypothetical protein